MTFALIAEFPLGTYRGRTARGSAELLPSPARLHAALVCAAAQGTGGVPGEHHLVPSERAKQLLTWLEETPPTGIRVSGQVMNPSDATAYRKEGTLPKESGKWVVKVAGQPTPEPVALNGPIAWTWAQPPENSVQATLSELCSDVSHLGTSESPVRLFVGDVDATHNLDPIADAWTSDGIDVDVAQSGRTTALVDAHASLNAMPSVAKDAHRSSDAIERPPVVSSCRTRARYRRPSETDSTSPWLRVAMLDAGRTLECKEHVRWAVAVHRALVSMIGIGAPSVVTGSYSEGVARPTNRVAVQVIPPDLPLAGAATKYSTLAVLLPRDISEPDTRSVAAALSRLRVIRGPGGSNVPVKPDIAIHSGEGFWAPPPVGHRRLWRTSTAAVPDTRAPRGISWTFQDAARLSVALVWRDQFDASGRGDRRYRALAQAAADRGVEVRWASRVRDSDVRRYVHKVNPDALVAPYTAELSLGSLASDTTLVAIGQSRHLGGGLLVPYDIPSSPIGNA